MSDVAISLPPPSIPKPLSPASSPSSSSSPSSRAVPAKPRPPLAITKPLPPPIIIASSKGSKEKQKVNRARQRFSPPAIPPPAPPTISPSPPPYSSISPPHSFPLPLAPTPPTDIHQRTPPPRPPPPSIAPPSAPPRPLSPESSPPSSKLPLPSAPPKTQEEEVVVNGGSEEVIAAGSEGVVGEGRESEGAGRGEGGGEMEEEEEHYERAPISQGAATILNIDGGKEDSGPEYVNVDSLDEEEEEEGGEEEEHRTQSIRHSVIRQDYQNWDFLGNSDSENSEDDDINHTPRPTQRHHTPTPSNPPTLPLNTHPVLMSQFAGGSKMKGGKRRNRAPPPPPGVSKRKGGGKSGAVGHKVGAKEGEEGRRGKGGREEEENERVTMAEGSTRVGENEEVTEHDYSTIPRTNYINWEFEKEDGSDSDENSATPTPKPKAAKPSNPPTLPLNTHPILTRSQSHGDIVESTDEPGGDGRRPRNRAPPPPPAKTKSKPPRGFLHQLSHQPLSTPPQTQSGNKQSTGREGGEYARVTKPPAAHKRTKSDQQPVDSDSDIHPGLSQERETGPNNRPQNSPKQQSRTKDPNIQGKISPPQQKSTPRSGVLPQQKSPLATHKNGEATAPQDHRVKNSVPGASGEREGVRVGGGPPARPPPRAPAAAAGRKKRLSAAEHEVEGRGKERESPLHTNLRRKESGGAVENLSRPKRQAPPPPVSRLTSVDHSVDHTGQESPQGAEALADRLTSDVKSENKPQTPPPKPKRLHRQTPPVAVDTVVIATEASPTTQESTETEERQSPSPRAENGQGLDRWKRLLHKMEFFTIDLIKDGDRSLGMVIVSGKVRNKDGTTVEGIFIQKILPGSLTDKDGRIQAGDMLVEINSISMVGATVELASKKLRESKDSVKLKVGRPEVGTFKVPGEDSMEPIYVNSDEMEDVDLQVRLEKAEARAEKMEELHDKANNELKAVREKAEKEQNTFKMKLEEAEKEKATYTKGTQEKINDLIIALANITVDKTKLEKEVEGLKSAQVLSASSQDSSQDEEITRLKRELKEVESEREMAERHLKELRQEMEGMTGLQSRLAALDSDLAEAQQERESVKRQLESTCHELTVAHATLEQMQIEKTAMTEENQKLSEELERVRQPSAGRAGVEAEVALKRKELSSAQRELQSVREEKERAEREAGEVRRELERENEKVAELESKLELQQKADKSATSELLSRIESQAQQIQDLKSEARAQGSVAALKPTPEKEVGRGGVREDSEGESDRRQGPLRVRIKQRSLDIETSPEHNRTQSPPSEASRTSSANKDSQDKSSSPAKDKSPRSLRDQPHDDSISIEAFDTIKPLEMLDNTLAKDKTQVALRTAKRARNKPSREHIRSMSAENLLSELDTLTPDASSSPTEKLPVPRPRKATLEKDSPSHKPLPVPRHLRSPVPLQNESPLPQRPPKSETSPGSPDRKARSGGRFSPPHTRAPSPKPLLPPSAKNGLPPKPVPRRPPKRGEDPPVMEDTPTKDPSQLTVKERMELAHKAMKKPPPLVPKKPPSSRGVVDGDSGLKSLSQPEGDEGGELPGTRYSVDAHSPRPVRKLPPGAFNIALVPMAPFGPSRHRSNTTTGGSREQSQDREISDDNIDTPQRVEETDSGSREALDVDDIEIKLPPKRPPLPLSRRTASNEKPAQLSSRNDDVPEEQAPPPVDEPSSDGDTATAKTEEEIKVHGEHGTLPDPSTLDYSQVLVWTPAQVAAWITQIGFSQHAKGFLDKGVQGNKVFDIDNSGLKAMGVSSVDDRANIKREIKGLRQHAEKQRKVLEKQRKDDKKKKKRQFV